MVKTRIDKLLVMQGYFESREQAKRALMAGEILINDIVVDKAGMNVDMDANIRVKSHRSKYVSRGGYKLEKAINVFGLDLVGKICMDVGASTGGFTDCMLQAGARAVYAVDVGYGQLDYKIREDERVFVYERTNARELGNIVFEHEIAFCSVDVSFISLKLVLPAILSKLSVYGEIVCLVKPQFEAGREKVGKGGVVRDEKVHQDVLKNVIIFANSLGLKRLNTDFSPITGPNGNIEFLVHLKKDADCGEMHTELDLESLIEKVVKAAHLQLK